MSAKRRTKGAGGIRRLPSGRYQARFLAPDGKRHTAPKTFETKQDAAAWLVSQSDAVRNDFWEPPQKQARGQQFTLNDYFREWIRDQDQIRATTRELYASQWRRLVQDSIGALSFASLDETVVRRWRQGLDPDAPTQRKQVYALVRQVLNSATNDRLIQRNPAVLHKFQVKRAHEPVVLTPKEIHAAAEYLPERYQSLLLISAWCALRFGEAVAIQRRDVDIENSIIRIRRGAVRVKGGTVMNDPKSAAGVRDVKVPNRAMEPLIRHLEKFVDDDPMSLVFPGRNGGILAPSSLNKVWYPVREKLGHPKMHWHDLRHTGAFHASGGGVPLIDIQARLGHSSVAAAMKYQHTSDPRQAEIAARLDLL